MNVDFESSRIFYLIKSYFKIVLVTILVFHTTSLANTSPILVRNLKLSGIVNGITLAGGYAYVATCSKNSNSGKLEILDIKNPANPRRIGSIEIASCISRVAISETYAYVSECTAGKLKVISIADPKNPMLVGKQNTSSCNKIAIAEGFAYIANAGKNVGIYDKKDGRLLKINYEKGSGLEIFDVKNPIAPILVGSLGLSGELQGVTVAKNLAYVIDGGTVDGARRTDGVYEDAGLKVVNITNPKNPVLISKLKAYRVFGGPVIAGNYAYIVESENPIIGKTELKIINIANPANPVIAGSLKIDVSSGQIEAVEGDYAYVSYHNYNKQLGKFNEDSGIKIINIANPANPTIARSLKVEDFVNEIAVTKQYIYVANGKAGLKVYQLAISHQ